MLSTFLLTYEKLEDRWDIKGYIGKLDSIFPMQKLGKFIKERSIKVKLGDAPNETFSILGVTNKEGVIDTYDELGKNIKQPYKLVETNDITYNPYRVNVGSIGIVKSGLKGKYISPAYVVFYADEKYLLTEYLYLILSSNWFNETLRANTSGSVRQNLTFDLLSSLEIPVPEDVKIQEKIVKTYNDIKTEISELENENQNLLKEVDNYLMKELGIEIEQKAKKKFFCVGYEDLERWDVLNFINKRNSFNKYEYKKLSDIYNFKSRKWNKNNSDDGKFHYIEIGNIDAEIGLNGHTELQIREAPSRATQIVKTGDLMISTTRPYLKKFAIVDDNYDGKICSSGFSIIENSDKYDLDFLKYLLQSNYGVDILKDNMTGGLYPAITQKALENLEFPIPTLDIQKNIINGINNIKNKSKLNGERIEKLKVDLDEKIKGMILDGKDL
ncbi:restriction endonuclease subunit S [Candidatus Gracilibacteria bacterium]|nr:restriction endonuclease subunit S [Candidatus Gracilibacteria bacterium]